MCGVDDGLRHVTLDAGHAHVQPGRQPERAVVVAQIDLGVDSGVGRQLDLVRGGGDAHGADEAGGPAGGEELLGVGAVAGGSRRGQLDVQVAVRAVGLTLAPTGGVGLGGVQNGHGGLLKFGSVRSIRADC